MTAEQFQYFLIESRRNPLGFFKVLWPHIVFYAKQREMIESVRDNVETFVVAGNKLGKDFVAGGICLWGFLCHDPVRIVTTSVEGRHLRVLWEEIARYISNSVIPLDSRLGGPIICNHLDYRKVYTTGEKKGLRVPISYMMGIVYEKPEKLQGHHATGPNSFTMMVFDEASSAEDGAYKACQGWARRILAFGNPEQTNNFWRKGIEAGDVLAV